MTDIRPQNLPDAHRLASAVDLAAVMADELTTGRFDVCPWCGGWDSDGDDDALFHDCDGCELLDLLWLLGATS